jgi:hypothetical protein
MVAIPKVGGGAVRRSPRPCITIRPGGTCRAELESPTCALDLRHSSNCLSIARAKPRQEIRVLVRSEDDTTAQLIVATGTLSNDGKSFSVVVTRADGAQQTHDLCYRDLLKTLLSDID